MGGDWYRHYECTANGISSELGKGPRSLGGDRILTFKNQTTNFTVGERVTGKVSTASGMIIAIKDDDATGELRLTQ